MVLKFFQTPSVQALDIAHLDIAISLIARYFVREEDFLVFKYSEGKTEITNGNDVILDIIDKRLFSKEIWAVYAEECGNISFYTFMIPSEY